jgi:hypothetical protein
MASSSIVTMRLDDALIQRIDTAAERAGLSRTSYIVSWLPEAPDTSCITGTGPWLTGRSRSDEPVPAR